MGDIKLTEEISKNIKLVFDNEESFIRSFFGHLENVDLHSFFMGSTTHFFEVEWHRGDVSNKRISNSSFIDWKSTLDNEGVDNNG